MTYSQLALAMSKVDKDEAPKVRILGYLHGTLFEIGVTDGITLYAKDNVQYVNIVNVPGERFGLSVKLVGTIESLLDVTYSKLDEALWDALRIASNHVPNEPSVINHRFNSCKLEHLSFDIDEHVVLWKEELAELDKIVGELSIKLKDGL